MPIYICKNCGNLTETDAVDNLTCSKCGAPLEEKQQEKEEKPSQPIQLPTSEPTSALSATPPAEPAQSNAEKTETEEEPAVIPVAAQETKEEALSEQKSDEKPSPESTQSPIDLPSSPIPPGSPSQAQQSPDTTPQLVEVYENKELVACPQCGYGCDASWATCPICEAKISGSPDLKKVTDTDFTFDEKSVEHCEEVVVPGRGGVESGNPFSCRGDAVGGWR